MDHARPGRTPWSGTAKPRSATTTAGHGAGRGGWRLPGAGGGCSEQDMVIQPKIQRRTRRATSSTTASRRGPWSPARSPGASSGSTGRTTRAGRASCWSTTSRSRPSPEKAETGRDAEEGRSRPGPRPGAVQHLLLPLPRPTGRRPGHDRPARASRRPRRSTSDGSATRPPGHFFNVITNGYGAMYSYASRDPGRRPLGDRRLHPGAAAEPERPARRRPGRGAGQAGGEGAMSTDDLSIQDPAALAWLERVQRPALIAGVAGAVALRPGGRRRPQVVLPVVPGGLPVLARDRARQPGGRDAPPPRRRRLGVPDPPARSRRR